MDLNKSVFTRNDLDVVSLSPDGIYHLRYRDPVSGSLNFDGLAILLFPRNAFEEGFPHRIFKYGENGEQIWGEDPGVAEPWRLVGNITAVMGNCLVGENFNYERAEALRRRFSECNAEWLVWNFHVDDCFGCDYPLMGKLEDDGLGVVVRDKQFVPRDESRVRCFAQFASGDIVFYH